jgi:hypothetical protein
MVWWWAALGNGLFGLLCGWFAAWRTDRRRRRHEARAAHLHRMSVRLVDPAGFEIMEKIHGFRLQTRPTFEN